MADKGRPTIYSKELVDQICEKIETSELGLNRLCKENDFPRVSTLMRWLSEPDKAYFKERYTRAKEAQAEFMAERILEIADDTSNDNIHVEREDNSYDLPNNEWINRSRLRVDARKWLMSKILPKKYGDKIDVTTDGQPIVPITGMVINEMKQDKDS